MKTFKEFLDEDITEGWTRHKDGGYSADAAEINHHVKSGNALHCPKCREEIHSSAFKSHRDREGDTTMLTHRHKCGAHMTVYND